MIRNTQVRVTENSHMGTRFINKKNTNETLEEEYKRISRRQMCAPMRTRKFTVTLKDFPWKDDK